MFLSTRLVRVITLFFVGLPVFAFAEVPQPAGGGGPVLLLLTMYAFTLGQVWLLPVKIIYLKLWLRQQSFSKIMLWAVGMDIVSSIAGAFLYAYIICHVAPLIAGMESIRERGMSDTVLALGSWIMPLTRGVTDNSLAIQSTIFGFGMMYVLCSLIEFYFLRWMAGDNLGSARENMMKHCFYSNLLCFLGIGGIIGAYYYLL